MALTVQTAVRFRPVQTAFGSGAKLSVSPLEGVHRVHRERAPGRVGAFLSGPRPGRRGGDLILAERDQHRAKLLGNLVEGWIVNRVAVQVSIET